MAKGTVDGAAEPASVADLKSLSSLSAVPRRDVSDCSCAWGGTPARPAGGLDSTQPIICFGGYSLFCCRGF